MLDKAARERELAEEAEEFLQKSFGIRLGLQDVHAPSLPHFLLDGYRLWQGQLEGQPLLLVMIRNPGQGAITHFVKHREMLRERLGIKLILLLLPRTPAAIRRQLVDRQIGFLAPGAQVYIPEAFLNLEGRSGRAHSEPQQDRFGPATQLLILAALYGQVTNGMHLTELAERLKLSIMSMSRTLDELENRGIAEARQVGRQRKLHLNLGGRALWDIAAPLLQSPVRKSRTVRGKIPENRAPFAGESALARVTMLAEPRFPHRAVAAIRWKRLEADLGLRTGFDFDDSDRIELETWSYEPCLFARDSAVDPLSLYLSVRHSSDERVAQAAEQLLETFEW